MYTPYLVPISIKGIVIENNKVWLRKNERDEWELPGGKLDQGEQPEETIIRELREELGFKVEVIKIVHAYMYTIKKSIDETHGVLVVSYLCNIVEKVGDFETIGEAGEAKFESFEISEIDKLNIPNFYREAISQAITLI